MQQQTYDDLSADRRAAFDKSSRAMIDQSVPSGMVQISAPGRPTVNRPVSEVDPYDPYPAKPIVQSQRQRVADAMKAWPFKKRY